MLLIFRSSGAGGSHGEQDGPGNIWPGFVKPQRDAEGTAEFRRVLRRGAQSIILCVTLRNTLCNSAVLQTQKKSEKRVKLHPKPETPVSFLLAVGMTGCFFYFMSQWSVIPTKEETLTRPSSAHEDP